MLQPPSIVKAEVGGKQCLVTGYRDTVMLLNMEKFYVMWGVGAVEALFSLTAGVIAADCNESSSHP